MSVCVMSNSKLLIYFVGQRDKTYQDLIRNFDSQYDFIHRSDTAYADYAFSDKLLAVVIDQNYALKASPRIKDYMINPKIPLIGLVDSLLVHPYSNFISDIVLIDRDDALGGFDKLESKLRAIRKDRFGPYDANRNFRKYILDELVKDRGLEEKLTSLYQPIRDLETNTIDRFEVLMRWVDTPFKQFRIDELFNSLDDPCLIDSLTLKQLDEVINFLVFMKTKTQRDYQAYINLSSCQLQNPYIVQDLYEKLLMAKISPGQLHFQIHTNDISPTDTSWQLCLQQLLDIGAKVSIKCANLREFNLSDWESVDLTSIKLRKPVIQEASQEDLERLLKSAKEMNIELIAEQIESSQDLDLIKQHSIGLAQGFLFHHPLGSSKLYELLSARQNVISFSWHS